MSELERVGLCCNVAGAFIAIQKKNRELNKRKIILDDSSHVVDDDDDALIDFSTSRFP